MEEAPAATVLDTLVSITVMKDPMARTNPLNTCLNFFNLIVFVLVLVAISADAEARSPELTCISKPAGVIDELLRPFRSTLFPFSRALNDGRSLLLVHCTLDPILTKPVLAPSKTNSVLKKNTLLISFCIIQENHVGRASLSTSKVQSPQIQRCLCEFLLWAQNGPNIIWGISKYFF